MPWVKGERSDRSHSSMTAPECPAIELDVSLPGERVVRVLDRVAAGRGYPIVVTCENGPEFRSEALDQWAHQHGVLLDFIDPGKPVQNAYIESFNGKFAMSA